VSNLRVLVSKNATIGVMLKSLIMKKIMNNQLKQVPEDQREMMEKMIEENPDLLLELAKDVQKEMKDGKDQMAALMSVAERNKDRLKKIIN
jgi:L-ribulose-5-phosphate 3-epimerase UlaE